MTRIPLLCLSLFLFTSPVSARELASAASAISAVVNDEVITSYDVDARVKFVIATTKIPSTPESIARLRPQIIRALIDEHLQTQEAKKEGIVVSEKEIEQAIAAIENQRDLEPGGIAAMMSANNIPPDTFTKQLRAQLAWNKLVGRKLRGKVIVGDEEVEQMVKKMERPAVKQEMEIALLQIPVDKASREKEVGKIAEKLVLDVRGGANFEEVSRQFAGGAVRAGGKLPSFWVRPDELDPIISKALNGAKAGSITDPLRNAMGFTIIKVYNTRDIGHQKPTGTEITFKEITLRLRSSANDKEADALKQIADDVAKSPGSCSDKGIANIQNLDQASIDVKKTATMLSDLPPALRVIAEGMKEGDISTPLASDEGIKLFMLCGKREGVVVSIDRDRAKNVVYQSRMELEAQKYMRNLRRDAFVEIR